MRACEVCGDVFKPTRKTQVNCSSYCRNHKYDRRFIRKDSRRVPKPESAESRANRILRGAW